MKTCIECRNGQTIKTDSDYCVKCLIWSELLQEHIQKSDSVYSHHHNSYIVRSEATLCECDEDYYTEEARDDLLAYCDHESVFRLIENCVFSEHHNTFFHDDDAVITEEEDVFSVSDEDRLWVSTDNGSIHNIDNCRHSDIENCWFHENDEDYVYLESENDYALIDSCTYCDGCNEYFLNDNCSYCDECNESTCDDCRCSCSEDSSHVHSYHSGPRNWKFTKEVHENTLFQGIEIEIELNDCDTDTVYEIASEYIDDDKFLLERDGSLNHGVEIIIHPHTLQALHKINFHGMFKKLVEQGCRAYEQGTCGLHVHVNRSAMKNENTIDRLCEFFVQNRCKLLSFSKRSEENCHQWARLHDQASDYKYRRASAINLEPSKTIEFRLFRGTLNFERFKSSLQFVDAIVSAQDASKNKTISWENFQDFCEIKKEYTILTKYMKSQNLFTN